MPVIYSGKFFCELCNKDRPIDLYGSESITVDDELKRKVDEHGRWYHWCYNHRTCAVCGQLIVSGDLESALNDGKIDIHPNYTDNYKKIRKGFLAGPTLNIHKSCLKEDR